MLLLNFLAPKPGYATPNYLQKACYHAIDGEVTCRTSPLRSVENAREPTISGITSYWIKKVAFQ